MSNVSSILFGNEGMYTHFHWSGLINENMASHRCATSLRSFEKIMIYFSNRIALRNSTIDGIDNLFSSGLYEKLSSFKNSDCKAEELFNL